MAHWSTTRTLTCRSGAVIKKTDTKDSCRHGRIDLFLPLILILGAFMFFASRRQKHAMQATIDLHKSLQVGDRVHTTSGLQGTIAGITDDTVDLEIAPGVVTTWMKLAVRDRIVDDIDDIQDTTTRTTPTSTTKLPIDRYRGHRAPEHQED